MEEMRYTSTMNALSRNFEISTCVSINALSVSDKYSNFPPLVASLDHFAGRKARSYGRLESCTRAS